MKDCAIIGGGPAGLAAAIYLSRFRMDCVLIDGGDSRASLIPRCRNLAGFPDGIPGPTLLSRMRQQLAHYDASVVSGTVRVLENTAQGMKITTDLQIIEARAVLLATGMKDKRPSFSSDKEHDAALEAGVLHYCPVCDGYEVSDKQVAVLGSGEHGMKEALFLRRYTDRLDLVCPAGHHELSPAQRQELEKAGIRLIDGPVTGLRLGGEGVQFETAAGQFEAQDIYAALGCEQRSGLAGKLGAKTTDIGCIVTDAHQRTTVENLYAAGDVVVGLAQVSTALGQAAIAATAIRNDLFART